MRAKTVVSISLPKQDDRAGPSELQARDNIFFDLENDDEIEDENNMQCGLHDLSDSESDSETAYDEERTEYATNAYYDRLNIYSSSQITRRLFQTFNNTARREHTLNVF